MYIVELARDILTPKASQPPPQAKQEARTQVSPLRPLLGAPETFSPSAGSWRHLVVGSGPHTLAGW